MSFQESEKLLQNFRKENVWLLQNFLDILKHAKNHHHRIYLVGNGGSAYVASHFASDLLNLGFDVVCLNTNIARLTALTNDIGWHYVYVEQLQHFQKGDVLILISVHGGRKTASFNLIKAANLANEKGGITLSLTGSDGGMLKPLSKICLIIPSEKCCYVEGLHSLLCHVICERLKKNGDGK